MTVFLVRNQRGCIRLNLSQCTPFLHSIKLSGYRMRIKVNKDPLAVEQKYTTRIVSAYIFYKLDAWPTNPLYNFKLRNCLFGVTNIVKYIYK